MVLAVRLNKLCFAFMSWGKSCLVLTRDNEGLDHLGVLDAHQHHVTGLGEVVQLRQPEVIAGMVSVLRVVRVAPQVTSP